MIKLNDTLLLRKPDQNDLEELYLLKNDVESNDLLGGFNTGYSKENISDWIHFHNKASNEVLFLIQDIKDGKLIGHVGLYNIDYRIRKAEFAILIANKNYKGKGIGNICTNYMLSYGFNQLNLNRIEISILSNNIISIALCKKNGFEQEGIQKQAQYKNGEYIDVVLMAKFRA